MTQQEKEAKLKDLQVQHLDLMDECLKIASKKSSIYPKINNKRAFKAIALCVQMRNLLLEIKNLSNEPILKEAYASDGISGIVCNDSEDITCMRGYYFKHLPKKKYEYLQTPKRAG